MIENGEEYMQKSKRSPFIDYIKYFCALEVIWLHSVNVKDSLGGMEEIVNNIVMKIMSVLPPVELFFVFSAFFFFSKHPNRSVLLHWIKRLGVTYVIYSILYLSQITSHFAGRGILLNTISLIRQYLFTGYGLMGWYIPALVWGGVVVYGLSMLNERLNNRWLSRLIIAVIVLLSMFGSSYYYLLPINPMSLFNKVFGGIGILRGIIYIYIGYELSSIDFKDRIGVKEIFGALILWLSMTLATTFVLSQGFALNTQGMLTRYLYVYSLSVLIFKMKNYALFTSESKSTDVGKMSASIYFTHVFIIDILSFIKIPILVWTITVAITSFVAKVIVLGNKKGVPICKYLV